MPVTNVLQTGSQLTNNFDLSKLFYGGNAFLTATYANTTGASITLSRGTLMGKITNLAQGSTNTVGYLWPFASDNTEGANRPVGILTTDVTLAAGATAVLTYCMAGKFDTNLLVFAKSGDTLDTVVVNSVTETVDTDAGVVATWRKAVRELIISETHLIGVAVDQVYLPDNQ